MNQYKPINLYTMVNKIILKALVIKFQKVLKMCINKNLEAFVPVRQTTSNILIAYKVLHPLKRKKRKGSLNHLI